MRMILLWGSTAFMAVDWLMYVLALPRAWRGRWYFNRLPGGGIAGWVVYRCALRRWRRRILRNQLAAMREAGLSDAQMRAAGVTARELRRLS